MNTATMNAIMIVIDSPPELVDSIPFNSPVIPSLWNPSYAPLNSKCPKLVIGTLAPAPPHESIISYNPKHDNNAPVITSMAFRCPGVRVVFSRIICPIAHINPHIINAFIYIILSLPN